MKKHLLTFGLLAFGFTSFAQFTPNRVVVSQYGDGTPIVNGTNALPVFLKEFKTKLDNAPTENTATYTVSMPTSGAGSGVNYPLTGTYSPTYEGLLNLSANGAYITMLGFGIAPGTAPASTDMRVLATVDVNGAVTSTTNVKGSANNLNSPRAAITVDGTGFWTIGDAGGIRYKSAGYGGASAATTNIDNTYSCRSVTIFNGKLYVAATATASPRIFKVSSSGGDLPTTSTGVSLTGLAGLSAATPNQLLFFRTAAGTGDPDLLYFTNDGGTKVEKWILNTGTSTWEKKGEISFGTDVPKGITGQIDLGLNKAYIYVNSDTKLISFEDTDVLASDLTTSTLTTIASAPANTKFRGVSLTPSSLTVLPVELKSFEGRQQSQSVRLDWATASESNNSHFNVLRANDNKQFQAIGKVEGNGNSNTLQKYAFVDANPFAGNNYYQLQQVDFNGNSEKSEVIMVKTDIKDKTLSIRQNGGQLEVNIHAYDAAKAQFYISNVSGQKMFDTSLQLSAGYTQKSVDISKFNAGVYIATVIIDGSKHTIKFIR